MPPPSWIGTLSPTAAIISRITFSFLGRPAMAPFRSTMCRRRAPCAAQCFAMATGSSEKTVAVLMSPCFRRTQRPSFRSIAGITSTSGAPAYEIGEELQAGGLAFFRVELDRENVIPGDRAGKGRAVHARGGAERPLARGGIVAVHEVKAAAVGDAFPEGVRPRLDHLVPAHVGDLQPLQAKARHLARQQREPGRRPLLGALEEHLQAEADAEVGLVAHRFEHRLARAARLEVAHAVGYRALARNHDSFTRKNFVRIRGDRDLDPGRDMLQRLGYGAQVAHPVIDDDDAQRRASYSEPLVDGMAPAARGSGSAAMRSAPANALNIVSH